jgi:hypothetical protein
VADIDAVVRGELANASWSINSNNRQFFSFSPALAKSSRLASKCKTGSMIVSFVSGR